jgi:hypothetical protein
VGWNCRYFLFAYSSVYTLKHFWNGMDTSLAWFTKAVMLCFYSVAIYLTMWAVMETSSSRDKGREGGSKHLVILNANYSKF